MSEQAAELEEPRKRKFPILLTSLLIIIILIARTMWLLFNPISMPDILRPYADKATLISWSRSLARTGTGRVIYKQVWSVSVPSETFIDTHPEIYAPDMWTLDSRVYGDVQSFASLPADISSYGTRDEPQTVVREAKVLKGDLGPISIEQQSELRKEALGWSVIQIDDLRPQNPLEQLIEAIGLHKWFHHKGVELTYVAPPEPHLAQHVKELRYNQGEKKAE